MPYHPPHTLTPLILSQVAEICGQVGRLDNSSGSDQENWGSRSPHLRKDNRIRSIHSSLAIENNSLSLDQVTAVIDGKQVLGLAREVQEVHNAFAAYESLSRWHPAKVDDLLMAHGLILEELAGDAGRFRKKGVGIYHGNQLVHMAPPADRVPHLVEQLFSWLRSTDVHPLVVSAIVHYELEFIHPFSDGNGRVGRLWQTLILSHWNPGFAFLPVESVIHQEQKAYYHALGKADSLAEATPFIEFILSAIISSLRHIESMPPIGSDLPADQVTDQVTDQVKKLLLALSPREEATVEHLMSALGLKHRPTFRANYLRPAMDQNLIAMTQPDSPNSPTQKYRLTNKGKAIDRTN